MPTLAYTHFQAAQPTTVGKRATLWTRDLLMDLDRLEHELSQLKLLGCKGLSTNSLCAMHGWNGQQRQNDETWDYGVMTINRMTRNGQDYDHCGFCVAGGAPCMGCTEPGYPDLMTPFCTR